MTALAVESQPHTSAAPHVDPRVLVHRLLRLYNPWKGIELERPRFFISVMRADPIEQYSEHGYEGYDPGRVRYLLDKILGGWTPDPIEIDNYFSYGRFSGLALLDGHHRLIAAHYARLKTIPAIVGGWVALSEWLCGTRRTMPEWGRS